MPRHLRIRQIVTTDLPGALCIDGICGINPDGTHWSLTRLQAVSQIENRMSNFYVEKPGGKRFDVVVALDPRANKYLKTTPDRDCSNELLFLPSCLHFAHTQKVHSLGVQACG